MLKCREATRLMSEAQDRELESGEHLSLRLHLMTCRGCRAYRRQMDFLRAACRAFPGKPDGADDEGGGGSPTLSD